MDEHPTKIYKLEKFGQGYDKQIILNYSKKTIGIRETNEKGYSSYMSREYNSIKDMMLYVSKFFSLTDWRIVEVDWLDSLVGIIPTKYLVNELEKEVDKVEFKEGMVFRCKGNYYVLALIQDGQYLILSDDEIYGWDLHESPNYEQIISSKVYNGYIPVCNGKERKFVTGWWYGATQLESTFRYVSDLEEVKHHFIVKDNMLDLYLRVKDDSVEVKPKETMSLRTAMEYAESINDKVEEILQILELLDEKGVIYTFTDDYFEVSVDNRHYTITFNK